MMSEDIGMLEAPPGLSIGSSGDPVIQVHTIRRRLSPRGNRRLFVCNRLRL